MTSNDRAVIYSGQTEQNQSGVGMILSKETTRSLIGWEPMSNRIHATRFQSCHAKTIIIQVYASAEDSAEADKDDLYDDLLDTFNGIPNQYIKVLMGDLNAKTDRNRTSFGPHGSAQKTNDNG